MLQVETEVNMFPIELSLRSHIIKVANEEQNVPAWEKIKPSEYTAYFNYDLKPKTWNLLVNKQIYMRFEKLLIEKQLAEVASRKAALEEELQSLEEKTKEMRESKKRYQ